MITSNRPWGTYTIIEEAPNYKVKRIVVKPEQRLSYQYHHMREENWTVVSGVGLITLNGEEILLEVGQSVFIPCLAKHRISNSGSEDLVFIEVQTGSYFGEDDIVRLEDDYKRD